MIQNFTDQIPPELGGEARDYSYKLIDGEGNIDSIFEMVFPILKQKSKNRWVFKGTGFFITTNGLFVTAKHVLEDVLDKNREPQYPIAVFQILSNKNVIIRPIIQFSTHGQADVGIGLAQQILNNDPNIPILNKIGILTTEFPLIGDRVVTLAYPRSKVITHEDGQSFIFMPNFYDGIVHEYCKKGRDKAIPTPCFRTSINIHFGASGGPVFGPDGKIFGINTSGFNVEKGDSISYVTRINEILLLPINNVLLPGKKKSTSTNVWELARLGKVIFEPSVNHIRIKDVKGNEYFWPGISWPYKED